MAERPRFFDDLAGVAGGAFSALAGMREEVEATIRARVDEAIRRLDLVKREDLEAVQEMAAAARTGQERAEARLAALEARFATPAPSAAAQGDAVMGRPMADGMEAPPAAAPPAMTEYGSPLEPPPVA